MKNNIYKKIFATLVLTAFAGSNSILTACAMENSDPSAPILRNNNPNEFSMRLKGDVNYITSKEPVSISLRDSDVKQVLRMFADKAGMNIVFHNSVDGKITLDLVDVPMSTAFDMIIGINNLNYVVENNTIIVAKSDAADFNMNKQDMNIIPIKYISAAAIADFLNKNIFGMNKPGLSGTEIVTTNPSTNEVIIFGSVNDVTVAKKVIEKFDKQPTNTTFKVNYTTPKEMADMVCKMLLPATGSSGGATGGAAGIMTGAAASSGGSSGGGSSSGGALALNGGTVACTMDGKLSGSMSSLGLQNLSVAYYPQLGTINIIGGSENQLEMIKKFIKDTDKKQPQAYLEVSIIELNEDGSKELTNQWTFLSKHFSATFNGEQTATDPYMPIFVRGDGYEVGQWESGTWKTDHILAPWQGPVNITYAINYLIRNGKGRVVVNPKIIVTNGVESKIDVTQDYLESVDIDSSTSTGGTVISRKYNVSDDQGVQISITPFISPDGYVTMNIKPEYSTFLDTITGTETINGKSVTYTAATLLSHRNLDLKNIRIKDGETLVLAGMIQEREAKNVNKIPVLGDIPGIGVLFRSSNSTRTKSEMIIMITPKIITDNDQAVGNTDTL